MKKSIVLSVIILLTIKANSQGTWQSNPKFYPFLSGVINPYNNGNSAVAIEGGILNKNTLFKVGIGTGSWKKSDAIIVIGASKRLFKIHRFEEWFTLSTSESLVQHIDYNVGTQLVSQLWIDKTLALKATATNHFIIKEPKLYKPAFAFGVVLVFGRGSVNSLN